MACLLDAAVVDALTGHTQYAQAGGAVAAKIAGNIAKMTGSASIIRNGVAIDVQVGDVVYQNDVLQTGSSSAVGLVLIDGTAFNLQRKRAVDAERSYIRYQQYVEFFFHHSCARRR